MPCKRLNPQLAKIHRSYTTDEVARLYDLHLRTVRNWFGEGLPVLKDRKPHLILGKDLREFLTTRRQKMRQPCGSGKLYCLRCREPKWPAGDMLDYLPINRVSGNLQGICPSCDALMHRRVSQSKIDEVKGRCAVSYPQGHQRLADTRSPSQYCHMATETLTHAKTQ